MLLIQQDAATRAAAIYRASHLSRQGFAMLLAVVLTACGGGEVTTANSSNTGTSDNAAATGGGFMAAAQAAPRIINATFIGAPAVSAAASAALASLAPARFAVAMDDMEVIGPFPSWANAKTDYGAKGDGVTDDAPALQKALNDLGKQDKASVLYLPAGNYKIGSTLKLNGSTDTKEGFGWGGVGLVGDAPSTTKITWAGPAGDAMLIQNGGFNTRYARITWDGAKTAQYGVAHWWNTKMGLLHGGSPEHVDEVFQDMAIGIMGGRLGHGYGELDSEGQVRRVTFVRNTYAGVDVGSWNALDWWIWDSHFVDCARGVTNTYSVNDKGVTIGAGGFYVYRSVFERSTVADAHIANTGWFSMHQNVSVGSRRFFQGEQAGVNPATVILKGNRVLDTTDPVAVINGNLGPLMLIDNQIRSAANSTGPAVVLNDQGTGREAASIGNQYTVPNPIKVVDATDRAVSIDDAVVARATISSALPAPVATPIRPARTVFEVPVGATADQIQKVVNDAVASTAVNPIVHLPPGLYQIDKTIVVPANARIQIAGDALTTLLSWKGPVGGVVFQLDGPSRATVRDMQIWTSARAIVANRANQSGGRVLIMGSSTGPVVGLDLTATQLSLQANTGTLSAELSNVNGFVSIGSGGFGPMSAVGSTAMIVDSWYEGASTSLFRAMSGTLTYMGGHMAPASHPGATQPDAPSVMFDGFKGSATIVGANFNLSGVPSGIGVRVNSEGADTNVLVLGMVSSKKDSFLRTASGGNVGYFLSKTVSAAGATVVAADQGQTSAAFLKKMLNQSRTLVWDAAPYQAPSGATDVRIYRVKADQTDGMAFSGQ